MSIELVQCIWGVIEPTLSLIGVCPYAVWFVSTLLMAMA